MNINEYRKGLKPFVPPALLPTTVGLPIHDFVEEQGHKKGFASHCETLPDGKPGGFGWLVVTRQEYAAIGVNVNGQYGGGRIGFYYNWAHAALWLAAVARYSKFGASQALVEAAQEAHAATARLGYEGMGLSGYSDASKAFVDALGLLVAPSAILAVDSAASNPLAKYKAYSSIESAKKEGLPATAKTFDNELGFAVICKDLMGYEPSVSARKCMLTALKVVIHYGDLERGAEEPRYGGAKFLDLTVGQLAPMIGVMRRQGRLMNDANKEQVISLIQDGEEEAGDRFLAKQTVDAVVKHALSNSPAVLALVLRTLNLQRGAWNAKLEQVERESDDAYFEYSE